MSEKVKSSWDKFTIEQLTAIAEGWQEQLMESEAELNKAEKYSQEWRTAFFKTRDARQALEELLGWTEHVGEFIEDAIAPDGRSIGHWSEEVYHKGEIQRRLEQPEKLLKQSNLGERFRDRTFASFDAKRDMTAFRACSNYANNTNLMSDKRNGLIIAGGYGSGKTHLAAAISKVLIDRGIEVLFGTSISHLESIRNDFENTGINRYEARMKSVPMLVIDDLGKEKKTDWTKQVLFDVVNYRYEHKLPLIVTTNLVDGDGDFGALANHVEGAVWSRFCEMCNIVNTNGRDYRQGA